MNFVDFSDVDISIFLICFQESKITNVNVKKKIGPRGFIYFTAHLHI